MLVGKKVNRVAIIGGARIPFSRSGANYSGLTNFDLMSGALKALVKKYELQGKQLGDVSLGAVIKSGRDFNLARECAIESGLSADTPAFDVQRACGTSLEAAILIANKIALGQIDSGIAGGCDSNSVVPIEVSEGLAQALLKINNSKTLIDKLNILKDLRPKDIIPRYPSIKEPRTLLSMGESCEKMAKEWEVSRQEQDELALKSHKNATKAYEEGFFNDLVFEFNNLKKDNNVRAESSLEKLATLKPSFDKAGTLTAGNSTPKTDGASAVFLCSEDYAKINGLKPLAYLTACEVAAVDFVSKEGLLMAPAYAVPRMLARMNLKLQDFDFYEIHEAFAAQVLCTLKAWDSDVFCSKNFGLANKLGQIDINKLNVKGGSVAIGHPFAATGSRIIGSLAKLLDLNGGGKGLISVCTAGGMGVVAIIEKN